MKKVITLFTLSFLCFLLANGQNWKHLGNLPVVPNSVFKDGQVMYASTNSDFLMSEDGGQTWESKMKIPIQDSIIAIYSGQEKLNWLKGIFYKEIQFLQKGYLTCCFGNGRIAINQQNLNTLDETFVSGIFTGGRTPTYIDGVFKKDDQTYIISTNTVGQIYDLTVTTDGGQTWHKAAEQRHYPIGWINDQLVMGPVDFNNVPLSIKIRNEVDAHDSFTVPMPPNEGRYFVEDGLIYSISRKDDKTITICDIDPYSGNAWSCTDFDSGIDIPTYGAIEWYLFGGAVFYHVNTFENGEHGREFWRKSSIKDQSDFEKIDIGVDLKGHAAELHTTSPNHLFLTTGQSKFYESTDAGVTWNEVQIEGPNPKSDSYNLEIKQNTPFVNINDENLHINSHSAPFSEDWRPVEFNIRDLDPNWELKKFEMTSWGGYLLAYENGGLYLWGGYDNAPMETMVEPISATPSEIGLNHYGYQSFYYTKEHSEMGEAYFGSGIFPPIKTGGVHRTKYLKSGLRILAANAQSGFYDYTLNEGETWNATTLSANENLKIDIITGDLYYFHGKTLFRSLDHGDNFEEFELTEFFNPFVHFSPRRYNPDSELLIGNQVLRIVENRLYALKIGEDYYEKVNTPFVRAVDMDLTSSGKLYFQSLAEGVWSVDLFDILPPNGEKADLVVTSDPIYRIDTLQSGDRISNARFTVRNMGRDISGPSVIRWYVSKNESPDFGHSFRFFGSETISPLAPGASVEVSKPGLTVDENWDSGTYYFNAAVNLLSPQTEESDFTNNSAFQIFIKDYPSAPQANLRNKNFDNFYYEADAGTQFNFEQIIANAGNLRSGTTNVKYALSEDQIFDSSDFIFNDITTLPELRAAENYTSNITLEIPENIPSRTYYFLSIIDDENVISEIDENDNVSYFFLNVQGAEPLLNDLEIELKTTNTLPEVGEEFTVTLTVKSKGNIYSFDNLIHFEIPYGLEMAPNERLEYPEFTYFAPDSNWWFLDIMPNEERILSAKLVRTKDVPINLFSQVVSTYPADLDSEPDNGICCNAVEDDEAILRFKLVRLSNPNVSTRGNDTLIDFSCRAFPNPFKNELNFNIKSERQGDGKIQIYDVLGRLILEKPIQLLIGENLETIETTTLPPGILTAKISNSENEFQRIQILKQ